MNYYLSRNNKLEVFVTNKTMFVLPIILVWISLHSTKCANESDFSSSEESTNVKIQCVPIRQCDSVMKHLRSQPLSQKSKEYIQSLKCSTFGESPQVWCASFNGQQSADIKQIVKATLPDPEAKQCGAPWTRDPMDEELDGGLIAFGDNSGVGEFPWMAQLEYRNRRNLLLPKCGGSLINSRYILTAAHCLAVDPRINLKLESVLLGEHDTKQEKDCVILFCTKVCCSETVRHQVERSIPHPLYQDSAKNGKHYHDIGLIRLVDEVKFTAFIKPICLPLPSFEINNIYTLQVAGWGLTENDSVSNILQRLDLPLFDSSNCSKLLQYELSESQLCAGGQNRQNSCNGDPGGPLMYLPSLFDMQYTQIGIVSLSVGKTCASGRPNVYTDVRKYMEWIRDSIEV